MYQLVKMIDDFGCSFNIYNDSEIEMKASVCEFIEAVNLVSFIIV